MPHPCRDADDSEITRSTHVEWEVRSRYATIHGDCVTLLLEPATGRGAISHVREWPVAPQLVEYLDSADAINAFIDSVTQADGRGVVAQREG